MEKTIILLSGWAGSGKDAAAILLMEEMSFDRLAFADALKEEVSRISGLPLHLFFDRALKDTPIGDTDVTPRQLLLQHALIIRATDPDIYARKIAAMCGSRTVISDWRYRREYEYMANQGFTVIRVRITRASVRPSDDPSEHDLDNEPFDAVIANDGSVSDLRDSLKAAIRPRVS